MILSDEEIKLIKKSLTNKEIDYCKGILLDHMKEKYPHVKLSKEAIMARSTLAVAMVHRDDLTTNQVIEEMFDVLLGEYNT